MTINYIIQYIKGIEIIRGNVKMNWKAGYLSCTHFLPRKKWVQLR